ncbi:hypothetical protein [Bradyrhizobium embrapense]|uniref:hypothetical protein n=1 Tax=Bradyrhizobium embrapense TaxID=630921 RepID=UPI0007C4DBF0|nr:hypothetical protein [Bradyrhizobium embrapense]
MADHGGFNIEATVALHAKGSVPEYEKSGQPIPADLNEFNRRTIIRINNSIDGKRKKYLDSYATLQHVRQRPFVLAITAIDNPHARLTCQRAIEAVLFGYYVDEERYLREGGELKGHQLECVPTEAERPLDPSIFRHRDVFQAYYSEADGEWVYERRDGQLISRQVFTMIARD